MIISSGDTWDHLINFFEGWRTNYQEQVDTFEDGEIKQYLMKHIQIGQAGIDLVSKLREHPQISKYVPNRGMWILTWEGENCSLSVYSMGNKDDYLLDFYSINSEIERSVVILDKVADRVYAYIAPFLSESAIKPRPSGWGI